MKLFGREKKKKGGCCGQFEVEEIQEEEQPDSRETGEKGVKKEEK